MGKKQINEEKKLPSAQEIIKKAQEAIERHKKEEESFEAKINKIFKLKPRKTRSFASRANKNLLTKNEKDNLLCYNCRVNESCVWRSIDGCLTCNACYLYFKRKLRSRPTDLNCKKYKKKEN